jgi:small GTP-binding protein
VGIFDRIDRIAEQLGDLIVPDDVRAHVELGAAYLDRGDLDAAVTELSRAVELRPDHPRALYLLGVAYARRGDEQDAIGALERAATARRVGVDRPGFAEAWLALADVHRRRGDDDSAVDAYRAALDAGVGDSAMRAEIYRGLGSVYLRQRRYDKAVRELRKAVAATPDDTETQGLLGRALYLKGDYDTARVCLERAAQAARPDPLGLASLGDLFERLGRVDDARDAYQRALTADDADVQIAARLGLARLALARGDAAAARTEALQALERDPARPDILTMLGRIYGSAQQWDDALQAYDRALVSGAGGAGQRGQLMLFDRRGLLEEALRAALRAGATTRANNYATALLVDAPEHPDALAATARTAAESGELDRAQQLVERALAGGDSLEARLAAADVALRRGQPAQAATALRRAAQLAPDDPRPRARLAEVYREAAPSTTAPSPELYALLSQAHRLFARTRELAELSPEAGRLVEVLDRPLLVTVMGEFNSGKSTFVNALIGEEVAPMGITPTTATINVLKYGAERKGRVVYHDDEVREVEWADVPKLLKGLDAAEAARIRVVEVLYPLETLQRVNVVDTPGLNSIHPEHEATARKFIAEADAVLWLFTVDQAAKATEGEALGKIKAAGKKILGVVNKIDRCTPEEMQRIVAHVTEALGEHLETIVPFAAREALLARKQHDEAQLAASNYPALASALEERFFSRARAIKREAATTRLRQLLAQARAAGHAQLDRRALEPLATAEANVRAERLAFERDFIIAERRRLNEAADAVYAACAREVLDFVRPRRWPFGSNEAAPADRDFLIQLLDERLGALLDAGRARAEAEAQKAIAAVRAVDERGGDDARFDAELSLLAEQVFGRFRAFARGYLRGGRVDDFFTRVLPKLELNEVAIQRALERDAPWSDDVAEAELRAPLRRWADRFYGGLLSRLQRLRTSVELDRLEIEERLIAPVEHLSIALDSLS